MAIPGIIADVTPGFVSPPVYGTGLRLRGSTSGYVGFIPAAAAGSVDYTLPSAAPGTNGDALVCTTGGVLSWATVTADLSTCVLLAGRATPQTIAFGTSAGATAGYLTSTSHATKGGYSLTASGSFYVDEVNNSLTLKRSGNVLNLQPLAGTSPVYMSATNNSGYLQAGIDGSAGGYMAIGALAYSATVGTGVNKAFHLCSNNVVRATVDNAGLFGINKISSIGAQLHVVSSGAAVIGAIVQGAASQSANLQEWQNSAGTVKAGMSVAGLLTVGSILSAGAGLTCDGASYGGHSGNFYMYTGTGNYLFVGSTSISTPRTGTFTIQSDGDPSNLLIKCGDNNGGGGGGTLTLQGGNGALGNGGCTIVGGEYAGTNIAGGNLRFKPGRSSGSATPATIILQGTTVGSSGTTLQTLSDVITITNSALVTLADGVNIDLNATTGTKWGRVTDKQAWWGATPIVQPAHANQAAITDNTTGTASFTLGAIVGALYATDAPAIRDAIASLARQADEHRNVLVNTGHMKGSA